MSKTYSASVRSILPVLLSARRVSPPSELTHGGKEVGKDVVEYRYDQVRCSFPIPLLSLTLSLPKPVPIPSYIIAIASGNVVYKAFPKLEGKEWTTGVWTEPEIMDAAYWEFSKDTANYISIAEEIVTPYVLPQVGISHGSPHFLLIRYEFGVYDVLLLPPSFPYGEPTLAQKLRYFN